MIYWLIFVTWVLYAYLIKKNGLHHLWIAFSLFILAALLKIVTLDKLAEPIMRASFLGWVIGFFISFMEYRQKS